MAHEPIAIIGLGCRFPGAEGPAELWDLLRRGGQSIGEVPASRFDLREWFDPHPATPGRIASRWGGYLDAIDGFDAACFGMSPREAERLDPQQRLLLEVTWEAFEDAGLPLDRLAGSRTGVFAGLWLNEYETRLFADPARIDFFSTTGSGRYAASGRLSFVFNLHGPGITIDTACSSSLVAIHLACQSLRTGESDLAIAGGANVILEPNITIAYSQSSMMAPDGRCKFGDERGDGYVRSEGAGVVVLKPLSHALADGDGIYATILGSAVLNDGSSGGSLGTPSRAGQERLLREAYRQAGVSPGRVHYVEAHGTGTRAGDPVELGALGSVLADGRAALGPCRVGSVKTNIGHTESAAGVAGVIKTVLAIQHREIPPSLDFTHPSPDVPWSGMPVVIPRALESWPDGEPLAGVSAFGIAGTNAHVVVSAPPSRQEALPTAEALRVFPLSARSDGALRELAARVASFGDAPGAIFEDACFTASCRRTHHEERLAVVGSDWMGVRADLRTYLNGEATPRVVRGRAEWGSSRKTAFVFSGQGSQWIGMGRELWATERVFREAIGRCGAALGRWVDWSLEELLRADQQDLRLARVDVVQPVLFAVQVALAALWRSLGICPDAVVGHSMGEVAAAHVAGVLDLDQAAWVICRRSRLLHEISGRGAMALVELSLGETRDAIAGRERALSIAASNSRDSSVISGDPRAIEEVLATLTARDVFCRLIKVDVASHSPQVEPLADRLSRDLDGLVPTAGSIPIYSTVTSQRADGRDLDGRYWASNLRNAVLLSPTVARMVADGLGAFVEVAPHPILVPAIERDLQQSASPAVVVGSTRRDEPERAALMLSLGRLFTSGSSVEWRAAWSETRPVVRLPRYPWQRQRHWFAGGARSRMVPPESTALPSGSHPSDGWLHRIEWRVAASQAEPGAQREPGGWMVIGDDAPLAREVAGAMRAIGANVWEIAADAVRKLRSSDEETAREGEGLLARNLVDHRSLAGVIVLCTNALDDAETATPESMEAAAAGHCLLAARAARAVAASGSHALIWFATRGAQPAGGSALRAASLPQATVWGLGRVIAEEHADNWGGIVDLDPDATDGTAAGALVSQCVSGDGEHQVALRHGQRLVARFVQVPSAAAAPRSAFHCRAESSYLLTGGLGGVGVEVAKWLAERGARWIILAGRTPIPPRELWDSIDPETQAGRKIQSIREVETSGASVYAPTADVADTSQLSDLHNAAARDGWPAVRGILHLAAAASDELVRDITPRGLAAALRPKVQGSWALHLATGEANLDFCVMFSSIGSILGQAGQASYAAANAFLDALAHYRHGRGLQALSVNWGGWARRGLAGESGGRQTLRSLSSAGIAAFEPEDGLRRLCDVLERGEVQAAVAPVDLPAFRQAHWSLADPRLFADLEPETTQASSPAAVKADIRTAMAAVPAAERPAFLASLVRGELAAVLGLAAELIGLDQPFGTIGLGSLLALELRNRLERALGLTLAATVLWRHPTVKRLAAYLEERLGATGATNAPPAAAAPSTATSAPAATRPDLASLSDDDALRTLLRGDG
jgi:acyl transferase domain-containing protein